MSTNEITPAPAPVKPSRPAETGPEVGEANMKGPFAMTQVNESVQREQREWGPFGQRKKNKKAKVEAEGSAPAIVEGAGEPVRHFKLLSLSKF
jgi:hypothetical protein